MHTSPGIEIAWGGTGWRRHQRRTVAPILGAACDLACEAMADMGVEYQKPKVMRIWRSARNWESDGASIDEQLFELYIRHDHIRRRKVARNITNYLLHISHELTHNVRREYFPDVGESDLFEHMAGEGLAYVSEDFVTAMLLTENDDAIYYGDLVDPSSSFVDQKKREAVQKWASLRDLPDEQDKMIDNWILAGRGLPPGVLIGITEVYRRLTEGATFPELLTWPPEAVLNLQVA